MTLEAQVDGMASVFVLFLDDDDHSMSVNDEKSLKLLVLNLFETKLG